MHADGSLPPQKFQQRLVIPSLPPPSPTKIKAIAAWDACPQLGIAPNSYLYSAMITACSSSHRPQAALGYFAAARAARAANEVVYGATIAACQRAGMYDRGEALLREMQGEGLVPDALIYCTLLVAAQRCAAGHRCATPLRLNVLAHSLRASLFSHEDLAPTSLV
jgi:pentatricopeptide repeat protein